MKRLIFLIALLNVGCLPTKNAPFLENELVFDTDIEGTWELVGDDGKVETMLVSKKDGHYETTLKGGDGKPHDWKFYVFRNSNGLFVAFDLFMPKEGQNERVYLTYRMGVHGKKIIICTHIIVPGSGPGAEAVDNRSTEQLHNYLSRCVKECRQFNKQVLVLTRQVEWDKKSALFSKKQRTFDYWLAMQTIMHAAKDPATLKKDEAIKELNRVALELKGLPTVGVDIEAATCLLQIAHGIDDLVLFSTTRRKAKSPVVSDTDAPILPAGSAALSWSVPSS
jgi:hypothetical protein